ncbi:YmdB family metallophosphoesterase [Treponema primitia]|uniref:TIGR00282 family metallophosphoesterase n=1 Tax=Treponema primitia TaxID=88058 RepID=UPI00398134A8
MPVLKLVMIGDVVGESGIAVLEKLLPALIEKEGVDFVVVNGENAAAGFGITEAEKTRILNAGADLITTGNHVWEKREFWPVLDQDERILRPANYPGKPAGRGWRVIRKNDVPWLVINLQGREQMTPIDCPFKAFDSIIDSQGALVTEFLPLLTTEGLTPDILQKFGAVVVVDFHAESTKEKEALGFYLDGRASVVAGTHTHVQTADERVLKQGTAYITDLGMTGVTGGVIGMDTKVCLDRARTQVLYRMNCADPSPGQAPELQGILAEIDRETGKAISIRRLRDS